MPEYRNPVVLSEASSKAQDAPSPFTEWRQFAARFKRRQHQPKPRMKDSTKNRVEGKARVIHGTLKEAAGVLTGSRRLKSEGRAEAVAGKVQNKIGQAEKVLGG